VPNFRLSRLGVTTSYFKTVLIAQVLPIKSAQRVHVSLFDRQSERSTQLGGQKVAWNQVFDCSQPIVEEPLVWH